MGFVRKSSAPSFIASTARSTVPYAVSSMHASEGLSFFAFFTSSTPLSPGMRTSDIRSASSGVASMTASACSASGAVMHSYVAPMARAMTSRVGFSSSTMSILRFVISGSLSVSRFSAGVS